MTQQVFLIKYKLTGLKIEELYKTADGVSHD